MSRDVCVLTLILVGSGSVALSPRKDGSDDGALPRRSAVLMRSLREHYTPAGGEAGEGAGAGLYTTFGAAKAFNVTRMDWVYSQNASFVAEARRLGLTGVSLAMNGCLPDTTADPQLRYQQRRASRELPPTGRGAGPSRGADRHELPPEAGLRTFNVGRIVNVHLQKLTAPWMRTWSPPPFYGCVNNPQYLSIAFAAADGLVADGASAIQHDDPTTNGEAVMWDQGDPASSGCYCSHCMAGFNAALNATLNTTEKLRLNITGSFDYREYLLRNGSVSASAHAHGGDPRASPRGQAHDGHRHVPLDASPAQELRSLFVAFQQNSTRRYLTQLRAHVDANAGRRVPFSCNNGIRGFGSPYDLFDYGIGELPRRAANPGNLRSILALQVPSGKAQVLTMPKEDPITPNDVFVTRWSIAFSYALGANMMVPWDIYLPGPSAHRYYGAAWQYGDLFSFIRSHAETLDGHNETFGIVPEKSMPLVHTGVNGDGMRWRLPSDTPPARGLGIAGASGASGCSWSCEMDAACVGMYVSASDGCVILYELILIQGTTLAGDSYERNKTGPVSPPTYSTDTPGVELVGRQGVVGSQFSRAIHITDWRYANSSGAPQSAINVSVDNAVLREPVGLTCMLAASVHLAQINQTLWPVPGRPASNGSRTVFTVPAPRPWSFLLVSHQGCR